MVDTCIKKDLNVIIVMTLFFMIFNIRLFDWEKSQK